MQEHFNRHHAKARNTIERTFGVLKTRWRSIFLRALEIRPFFAPKVIAACCILHNICAAAEDVLDEEEEAGLDEEKEEDLDVDVGEREQSGKRFRARLAAQVSAPAELPVCLGEHDYI